MRTLAAVLLIGVAISDVSANEAEGMTLKLSPLELPVPRVSTPVPPAVCVGCGHVSAIRAIERPVVRERNVLPNIASSPTFGSMGNATQPIPLLSLSKEGAHRVQPESSRRTIWEVTVRYDNGQFGFVIAENEPELNIGDRVRLIENSLEPLTPPR